MAREVILKFSDDDFNDAKLALNAGKMYSALWDLHNFRRNIYKGYCGSKIYVKDDKILNEENLMEVDGVETYIKDEEILQMLDSILEDVYDILEE